MTYNITTAPRPRRLTGRRIALVIAGMILTPCFIALFAGMVMGISRAAAETTPNRGPSAHTLDILDQARADSKTPCWAEWNEVQARLAAKGAKGIDGFPLDGFEVICAAR